MSIEQIIKVTATPVIVHDGDTYLLLLNLLGRGLREEGCQTQWVRLRDYSARELSDSAAEDPAGFGRLPGLDARNAAAQVLLQASEIVVQLLGFDPKHTVTGQSFGRYLGWMWVDGQSLGEVLEAQHVVANVAMEGESVGLKP